MKNSIYFKITLVASLLLTSCSKDADDPLSIGDVQVTFPEHKLSGTLVTTLPQPVEGLEYTLLSQSPTFSFNLNSTTGELSVNDASVFDFEVFPQLTAQVQVSDGTSESTFDVTVDLEDIDEILEILENESLARYLTAEDGDWVLINAYEYDYMKFNFPGAETVGASDSSYSWQSEDFYSLVTIPATMVVHGNNETIPPNSYVIGFKIATSSNFASYPGSQIKLAEQGPLGPLESLGGTLPTYTPGNNHVFVLKGNRTPSSATAPSYLAFYNPTATLYGDGSPSVATYIGEGNLQQLIPGTNAIDTQYRVQIQALYTPQKQAD